jgi:transcriptional regulator with XRE-family HTH domain
MKLRIGENIRRLRRERNLTQEEMAAHLGISFQSVSKWERCDGYPDITMLPALANYFGVSVDSLIGMDEIAKAGKYDEINRLWTENNRSGLHHENVLLMRDSLKTFPGDGLLLVQLSCSLEKLEGTKEEKEKNLRESIALQEQILRYGEDSEVRSATQYNICFAYWKNGEREKALEQAGKLPNLYKARENALVFFLEGEERYRTAKTALEPLAWAAALHLSVLAQEEGEPAYLERAGEIRRLLLGHGEEEIAESMSEKQRAELSE